MVILHQQVLKREKVVLEELKTRAEDDKASIDSIVGLWVSISADNYGDFTIEGVDKNQFIKIEQDGSAHMEIENIITDGQLKEDEYGWEFHSDYGTFFLFQVESLDSFKNGCFELSIDDIIYAYFKNIEEFE